MENKFSKEEAEEIRLTTVLKTKIEERFSEILASSKPSEE